jgi:N-acetylglucosaminyldiphosphoundecaprenol N-acetyl-beta-D-mannosaminyltransferase
MVDFNRQVFCLLGLPFDAIDMTTAVQRTRQAAASRRGLFISTPNLNFLIGCSADDEFRNSVINSDLSIADGMPLVWVARLLGIPIRNRVTGSGLFERLRTESSQSMSVYFFGGPEGVAERARRTLNAENTGMTCVGDDCPGFGSIEAMSSDAVITRINTSGADFLVVALGAKKGQAWIVHNRARITVPVISHLGAVVNFVAGTVSRAPLWMQRSGLEWLWRIKEEPALWRRYWQDGVAFVRLLVTRVLPHAWYRMSHPLSAAELERAAVQMDDATEAFIIRLQGGWSNANLDPLRQGFARAAGADKDVTLEMRGVSQVDSAFVGLVMLLHGHQIAHGVALRVVEPSQEVKRVFELSCAAFILRA